jgi:hypothetical protein
MTAGTTNFPGSLDSHTSASPLGFGEVNNQAYTLSTAAHTNSVTTITVASTSAFPSKGYLVIKREIVSYTGTTSTTFTGCTRGVGGTTAAAFLSSTLVEQVPVAANHNDLAAAIVAVETELIVRPHAEIVINGNFDHWQRGTSARTNTTTYSTDTSYAADRFFALPSGASITTQRSTTVPNSKAQYSALLTGASSVTTVDYGQRVRSALVAAMAYQSLVFSCYVRNVSGAAFTPNLRIGTPGSADSFGTVTNRLDQALQSCADSAWTRVYHVFDPSAYTNLANGMEVCLRIPSGSLVSGDTVYISQFSLHPGAALAAYAAPDPDTEFDRCAAYYQRFGPDAGAQLAAATGYAFSTTLGIFFQPYRRIMWKIPTTVALSDVTHFTMPPTGATITSMTAQPANHAARLDVSASGGGLTANQALNLQMQSASAYIEIRAEL